MRIIGILIPVAIISLIYLNLAPFIYSDTFGHYLRTKTVTHVYRYENGIYTSMEFDTLVEKCNPWLVFWRIAKLKPNIQEFRFDSTETEEIWNKLQGISNAQ